MPVDQFGMPADMDPIVALARCRGLAVIEDSACAIGSLYHGRPAGRLGDVGSFSFHPRKVVTTGEGGMVLVDDDRLATRARALVSHGSGPGDEFAEVGYNYRLTELQGAVGCVQMDRLPEMLADRRALAARYTAALAGLDGIVTPSVPAGVEPNWQSYAIRVDEASGVTRDAVVQALTAAGVASRPGYMACHLQPLYAPSGRPVSLPETEKALATVIILPLFPGMTEAQQDHVVDTLAQAVTPVAAARR
jgi:dTDP-4-amino-4,6-dideoxygalactose transaminase